MRRLQFGSFIPTMSREVLVERDLTVRCFLVLMHGMGRMNFYNAPDKAFEKLIKYLKAN